MSCVILHMEGDTSVAISYIIDNPKCLYHAMRPTALKRSAHRVTTYISCSRIIMLRCPYYAP